MVQSKGPTDMTLHALNSDSSYPLISDTKFKKYNEVMVIPTVWHKYSGFAACNQSSRAGEE